MRKLVGLFAVFATLTCSDHEPTAPDPSAPRAEISDAFHQSGNAHFYFLPPIVPAPTFSGGFDPSLSPVVRICEWAGGSCAVQVAEFTNSSGPGSEAVRVDQKSELYAVNWHTDQFGLDPAKSYRIRILVAGTELGFADVSVVSGGKALKNAQSGQVITLLDGTTLPIKFRIEIGAVFVVGPSGSSITSQDGNVTLQVPAGALSEPVGITVAPSTDYPSDPALVSGAEFRFGPEGTKFAKPVKLEIVYPPGNVPAGLSETALRIHKLINGQWVEVLSSSVNPAGHVASADITSFSQYGVLQGRQVGSVTVTPAAATVAAGCTLQLKGTVFDQAGNVISRPVIWSSDKTAVAAVDQTGLVTALAGGIATITGTSQPKNATAVVTVVAAAGGTSGFCMQINATALSAPRFSIGGVGSFPTSSAQSFKLPSGSYTIDASDGRAEFNVTTSGLFDYPTRFDQVQTGRGTNQLVVSGYPITLDASALSAPTTSVGGVTSFPTNTVPTLRLLPNIPGVPIGSGLSTYTLDAADGRTLFIVQDGGVLEYPSRVDPVQTGRGTDRLTVSGYPITLDASALSAPTTSVGGVTSFPTNTVPTLRLLPNISGVPIGSGLSTYTLDAADGRTLFIVQDGGVLDYPNHVDPVQIGRGSNRLTITGAAINIDATSLSMSNFSIGGIATFSTSSVQRVVFLPGTHGFASTALQFPFSVTPTATVDYDTSLDTRVSGRGTNTLVVH
jgi:uncharacterized protein YjdB